jgi:hypothetical protein
MIESAYIGEDVPLRAVFTDESGTAIAPDGFSGGSGPTVTVTAPDGSTPLSGTVMATEVEVGTYETVWDTSTLSTGDGTYYVSVTGEFGGETKIVEDEIILG